MKNSDVSFKLQPENAIHIRDYFYDKEDRELDRLTPFLIWLAEKNDVRPVWR
jgi:carboxy-terminal domain RNA polymerase II polypeptide A small phosphatase